MTNIHSTWFQIVTDRLYLLDGARATKLQAAVMKSPVYFYLFGYRGKNSITNRLTGFNMNLGKRRYLLLYGDIKIYITYFTVIKYNTYIGSNIN